MKLIKMTRPDYDIETPYKMDPRFALCAPVKNGFAKRVTPLTKCRENFIKCIRDKFKKQSGNVEIDQRRTRLIMVGRVNNACRREKPYNKLSKEELEKHFAFCADKRSVMAEKFRVGFRILNHFERRNEWQLSKLYGIDPGKDPQQVAFMLIGSPRWQKTPHYLSLLVLILRAGFKFHSVCKGWPGIKRSHSDIVKKLSNINTGLAFNYYSATIGKWDILMKYQDRIVGRKTMKEMFDRARLVHKDNGYSDGIYSLCMGNSYDLRMSYKLQKVCRELGIHQRVNVKPDLKFVL